MTKVLPWLAGSGCLWLLKATMIKSMPVWFATLPCVVPFFPFIIAFVIAAIIFLCSLFSTLVEEVAEFLEGVVEIFDKSEESSDGEA